MCLCLGVGGRFFGIAVLIMSAAQTSACCWRTHIHAHNNSIGLRAVFLNHQRTGKADLWSLHSWLGIAVITAFVANVRAPSLYDALGGWSFGGKAGLHTYPAGCSMSQTPTPTTHTHARTHETVRGGRALLLPASRLGAREGRRPSPTCLFGPVPVFRCHLHGGLLLPAAARCRRCVRAQSVHVHLMST